MEPSVTPFEHDVVGALLVRDARVLLCHRSPDREWYPDVWDVPGGHIEPGETVSSASASGASIAGPANP